MFKYVYNTHVYSHTHIHVMSIEEFRNIIIIPETDGKFYKFSSSCHPIVHNVLLLRSIASHSSRHTFRKYMYIVPTHEYTNPLSVYVLPILLFVMQLWTQTIWFKLQLQVSCRMVLLSVEWRSFFFFVLTWWCETNNNILMLQICHLM